MYNTITMPKITRIHRSCCNTKNSTKYIRRPGKNISCVKNKRRPIPGELDEKDHQNMHCAYRQF